MQLSIVIPTYNEKLNVLTLVEKIRAIFHSTEYTYEILFVDDSTDDTPAVLEKLSCQYPEVRYLHRENERGLASAVVAGFKAAQGQYLVVMDADLQHPPELIPLIASRLEQADIVIPSRFISGGSDGGLKGIRKLISWGARMIGRFALKKLRNISDCTGGFFGLRKEVVVGANLDPIGWKILIEVLAKGNYTTVHEIPYSFQLRTAGESKMSLREQWNYLRHIAKLVLSSPEDFRVYCFCLVGLLGVGVNLLALNLLLTMSRMGEMEASVGASLIALIHNFLWNDNVTWRDQAANNWLQRMFRLPQYALICGIGVAITALTAKGFLLMGWNLYIGQFTGILLATHWSFTANNWWTWARQNRAKPQITQEHGTVRTLKTVDSQLQVLEIKDKAHE